MQRPDASSVLREEQTHVPVSGGGSDACREREYDGFDWFGGGSEDCRKELDGRLAVLEACSVSGFQNHGVSGGAPSTPRP